MPFLCHYEQHGYSGFELSHVFDVVYGGHFEHRLLSAKRGVMQHRRLVLGDTHLETGSYDIPIVAQGAMPEHLVCIGMVVEGTEVTRYNTEPILDDVVQVYGPGADLMYHATGASRWIAYTAPMMTLQEIARERFGRPLALPERGIAAIQLDRGQRGYLKQMVDDAFSLAGALAPTPLSGELAQQISGAIATAYVDALCEADWAGRAVRTTTARRHYDLIRACERVVLAAGLNDIRIAEVSRRSGYSRRSLELIFRRGVGMTPGRWFMNIRLNNAMRELLAPKPDCSVTDVALRWGFRHLSRFADQYRRTFGELPGETLRRGRVRAH